MAATHNCDHQRTVGRADGDLSGGVKPATEHKRGLSGARSFKVQGLDCAEEVAVLKRALGSLVGGCRPAGV
jgi:hypothetical protein